MSTTDTHRELKQGIRYLVELVPAGAEFMFYARQVERMAVERTPIINPSADAIAAWVAFANDGTAAEAAVVRHLYLLSRGEGPDPLVAQVHPVSEPEPARVIDGLTVGARYLIGEVDEGAPKPGDGDIFDGKDGPRYRFRLVVDGRADEKWKHYVHESNVAAGAVWITDLDGNRVDYWAEQARAYAAAERTRRMGTPSDTSAYESPTFYALHRVLDEQESTR